MLSNNAYRPKHLLCFQLIQKRPTIGTFFYTRLTFLKKNTSLYILLNVIGKCVISRKGNPTINNRIFLDSYFNELHISTYKNKYFQNEFVILG